MFFVNVYQHRMLIMALMCGIIIALCFAVGALDMQRDREEKDDEDDAAGQGSGQDSGRMSGQRPARWAIPWFIIFSNIAIIALGILYTAATILNPPNW